MISDRLILFTSGWVTLAFMVCCIIDVTNTYALMDNVAILILLVSGYAFIIANIILRATNEEEEVEKNLPEPEEEPSEFRQI